MVPIKLTTVGQKWISGRLRELGFNPEYRDSKKYQKGLLAYLGLKKREALLDEIDRILRTSENSELEISKVIGADPVLLKMVYSTGIWLSIILLDRIMDIFDDLDLDPKHIVDFGGANGWSLLLLKEFLETEVDLSLIETNEVWGSVHEDIECVFETYETAGPERKADLGISIFGASYAHYKDLAECVNRNLTKDAIFICTLRIVDNTYFQEFISLMDRNGFRLDLTSSERIRIDTERFPIMVFRRSKRQHEEIESLDQLKLKS